MQIIAHHIRHGCRPRAGPDRRAPSGVERAATGPCARVGRRRCPRTMTDQERRNCLGQLLNCFVNHDGFRYAMGRVCYGAPHLDTGLVAAAPGAP